MSKHKELEDGQLENVAGGLQAAFIVTDGGAKKPITSGSSSEPYQAGEVGLVSDRS